MSHDSDHPMTKDSRKRAESLKNADAQAIAYAICDLTDAVNCVYIAIQDARTQRLGISDQQD